MTYATLIQPLTNSHIWRDSSNHLLAIRLVLLHLRHNLPRLLGMMRHPRVPKLKAVGFMSSYCRLRAPTVAYSRLKIPAPVNGRTKSGRMSPLLYPAHPVAF